MLIEFEGLLYRGNSLTEPEEIWRYPSKEWVRFHDGPIPPGEAFKIDADRAETLKINNSDAEYFSYYDRPPWSQPNNISECLPDHMRETLAKNSDWLKARRRSEES